MTRTSRAIPLVSGLIGGLVVAVIGAILIATGVIDTGEEKREVIRQEPVVTRTTGGAERGPTVSEIYRRTAPGVVFIRARGVSDETPFGPPQEGTATGTGFVIDKDGSILTNAHVVEGSDEVTVKFGEDSAPENAKVVGRDPSTDLAVLDVNVRESMLRPLRLGDSSNVTVGDPAIAIGNPFGLERTVTTGIVSALQRQIEAPNQFSIDNVIQTDAAVNPGNSGGPLLDGLGRVIGVNSQIATDSNSRSNAGVAFAVPVNTVKRVVPELKKSGKIDRAYLGVSTAPVTELAQDLNLPVDRGALIQEVVRGGPADRAGLRGGRTRTEEGATLGGDLIVKVDGQDVREPGDVAAAIADDKPGKTIEIEFFRGGKRRTVEVELGKRPANAAEARRGGGGGGRQPEPDSPFPLP